MPRELDIVSLGPGRINQMTIEARESLLKSKKIYCRFINPLLSYFIHKHKKHVVSFESLYSEPSLVQGTNRTGLYTKISEVVVNEALINDRIVYALPGSVFIGEDTTYLIYKMAKAKGLMVNMILGVSFIDVVFNSLPEKYKKYIHPNLIISFYNRSDIIPFSGYYSYIIALADNEINKLRTIEELLSRYYSKDFKFIYIYSENDENNFSYNMKTIEFQIKDVKKMITFFSKHNGSIFIPSCLIDQEIKFKISVK